MKKVRDTHTGLDRFFMSEGSIRFIEVSYPGKELLPRLEFMRLLEMENLEELQRRLPLDGVTYYLSHNTFYRRVVEGGQQKFVVVAAPAKAAVCRK